jgi:mannitol-specific phosphotransferase system IIBC component
MSDPVVATEPATAAKTSLLNQLSITLLAALVLSAVAVVILVVTTVSQNSNLSKDEALLKSVTTTSRAQAEKAAQTRSACLAEIEGITNAYTALDASDSHYRTAISSAQSDFGFATTVASEGDTLAAQAASDFIAAESAGADCK